MKRIMLATLVMWCFSVYGFTRGQFSGSNIALRKPATQYPGDLCYDVCYNASLAVDDKIDDPYTWQGHCTHTPEQTRTNAYWTVNFTDFYYITGIIVDNRIAVFSIGKRLRDFKLFGFGTGQNSEQLLYTYDYIFTSDNYPSKIEIQLPDNTYVSGIRIEIPHRGYPELTILTLCEVQVFSDLTCPTFKLDSVTKVSYTNNTYEGSIASFTCPKGYYLEGVNASTCSGQGWRWSNQQPVCLNIYCQYPSLANGRYDVLESCSLTSDGLPFGCSVQPKCNDGYILKQGSIRSCIDLNQWSEQVPVCEIVRCSLNSLQNGVFIFSNGLSVNDHYVDFGVSVFVKCNMGYNNSNAISMTCQQDGSWSGTFPTCVMITCAHPGNDYVLNGYTTDEFGNFYHSGYKNYSQTIKVVCDEGFTLATGLDIRICQENGVWNGTSPQCKQVMCDHPGRESLLHGSYTDGLGKTYLSGTQNFTQTIQIQCDTGYKVSSELITRTCQGNGTWSSDYAACIIITCQALDAIPHIIYVYSNSNYSFGSTVNVSCENGTVQNGSYIRLCSEKGTWNGTMSTCEFINDLTSTSTLTAGIIGGATGSATALVMIAVIVLVIFKRRAVYTRRSKNDESLSFHDIKQKEHGNAQHSDVSGLNSTDVRGSFARNKSKQSKGHTSDTSAKEVSAKDDVYQNTAAVETEDCYYAFGTKSTEHIPETAILVKKLSDLVLSGDAASQRFKKEFEDLPEGMKDSHSEAMKSKNRGKNRYKKLYAYDSTRVILDKENETDTDYINACYVHGFKKLKSYIASQGPIKEILVDFWKMVWQTKCGRIIMLTNLVELGKPKCEQYWPDEGSACYGNIDVTMKEADIFSDFIIRKFEIKKENLDKRQVTQYHFTAWPDKGVPKYASSLVQFRNKVKCDERDDEGPIVVHCSAGVGRTGTFIALDFLTDQARTMQFVDVFGCVQTLRRQRVNLVQTLEQYIFLHGALVETLMISSSALPASQFQAAYNKLLEIDDKTKMKKIEHEYEMLKKLSPVPAEDQYASAKEIKNLHKNRYNHILPVANFMPTLTPSTSNDDDYVNAVFLPSYKVNNAFIVTQTPLETTRSDFWKLVWEHNIYTIVMMNKTNEMQKNEIYWPEGKEAVTFGGVIISEDSKTTADSHTILTLNVKSFSMTRQIKLIQCGGWHAGKSLPDSPKVILSLLELVQSWQQTTGNQTILVHCMDGAEKSGLFCVVSAVIDRLKIEQDVAISHTIEEMRNAREQIIPSVTQYQFCHEAVLAYIQMNETYSNFTI